ncbi:ribonuclease HI [Sphingomonas sp. IC081]|nr:ribonuclease HI [Sphingomonas sp. IC081]QSR17567.1 ribonuclease HI [Novosphingobium sp. KA1]
MEVAVVVRGTVHFEDDLGHGTNRDAEWLALIRALELAQAQGLTGAEFIGDAREITGQASQALARPDEAADRLEDGGHLSRVIALARDVRPARIRWIKREQNLAGIALAARHPR